MGPLHGIRIVEMDAIGPVPLCATILADMGADIVRISRAGGHASYDDLGETILHRGRTSVELDLKSDVGVAQAHALIARADALIEGFRPGVMERLGLGPEQCHAKNRALVYGRMTGWGQTGPFAQRAGHDINYIAITGALSMFGPPDAPPPVPLNLVGDYGSGAMFLALGVLAGVLEARSSGKGQVVDAAMTDGGAMLLSLFTALRQSGSWSAQREDNLLDGGTPFYRCYACADGQYVAVGALEPKFFAQLLAGLKLAPEGFVQYDKTTWASMRESFSATFAEKNRDEWAQIFFETDACVSPVLDLLEAVDHPQNADRAAHHPIGGFIHPAPAPRFSRTPSAIKPNVTKSLDEALAKWNSVSRKP